MSDPSMFWTCRSMFCSAPAPPDARARPPTRRSTRRAPSAVAVFRSAQGGGGARTADETVMGLDLRRRDARDRTAQRARAVPGTRPAQVSGPTKANVALWRGTLVDGARCGDANRNEPAGGRRYAAHQDVWRRCSRDPERHRRRQARVSRAGARPAGYMGALRRGLGPVTRDALTLAARLPRRLLLALGE